MNSTIDSTPVVSASSASVAMDLMAIEIGVEHPHTLVIQPVGVLDQTNSQEFRRSLEQALERATDSVIVDFIWIEAVDAQGIAVLVAMAERAGILGKSILFQSMDRQTRRAMETEWDRQRTARFGCWNDVFAANLEQFLDNLGH